MFGSPAYDPALGAAANEVSSRRQRTGWSTLSANSLIYPMDNKPSFAVRIAALKAAAETVMLEAQRMEAAQSRFAERKASRQTQRASR